MAGPLPLYPASHHPGFVNLISRFNPCLVLILNPWAHLSNLHTADQPALFGRLPGIDPGGQTLYVVLAGSNLVEVVDVSVPEPGAGTIETPDVRDIYSFTATTGQSVYIDRLEQSGLSGIDWKLVNAEGTVIFDTC